MIESQGGGEVQAGQEGVVMADHNEGAWPRAHQVSEPGARFPIEVVCRLVQQRDRRTPQPNAGESDEQGFAPGYLAHAPIQVSYRQPDMTERLICSRLDVPVIPEHVEMVFCDVAALDRVQRGDLLGDARKVRDRRIDSKGERLLEVIGQESE